MIAVGDYVTIRKDLQALVESEYKLKGLDPSGCHEVVRVSGGQIFIADDPVHWWADQLRLVKFSSENVEDLI